MRFNILLSNLSTKQFVFDDQDCLNFLQEQFVDLKDSVLFIESTHASGCNWTFAAPNILERILSKVSVADLQNVSGQNQTPGRNR